MYLYIIAGILIFLYTKSRIYSNTIESFIIYKRHSIFNVFSVLKEFKLLRISKIVSNEPHKSLNTLKRLKYGNNFMFPLLDSICYIKNIKNPDHGQPLVIPGALINNSKEQNLFHFKNIKIYEKDDIILIVAFKCSLGCKDIDFFLNKIGNILENGFNPVIKKIIKELIENKLKSSEFIPMNVLNKYLNKRTFVETEDNEQENILKELKAEISNFLREILGKSLFTETKIESSNIDLVSARITSNKLIKF